MKTLDVQARLEYGRAAISVLRALKIADRTMRYHEFARAIGLIADGEDWQPWYRQQIGTSSIWSPPLRSRRVKTQDLIRSNLSGS